MQQRDPAQSEVLATPGHLISLAARAFARLSEARLKPLGFGVGCLPVLIALKSGVATTQRDLARFAKMEQPSMAEMLNRMERDGFIQRSPDPSDARSSCVRLTRTGRARLPRACAVLFQGNREAVDGFTEAEQAQFVKLLNKLITNVEAAEARGTSHL